MQPNQVKVGSSFFTRVAADSTAKVTVVEDTRIGTKRYRVQRIDTGAILRKLRGPGELHEGPGPWYKYVKGERKAKVAPAVRARAAAPKKPLAKAKPAATQAELLKRLEEMPADVRGFLAELIAAVAPPAAPSKTG